MAQQMDHSESPSWSSDDEAEDLEFMHHEIKREWEYVELQKKKLLYLENMDTRLELVRCLLSGEVHPSYADLYREDFQEKIEGGTEMAEKLKRRYDRIPKVYVLKDDERIDIFVRIDKGGATGKYIQQKTRGRVNHRRNERRLPGERFGHFEFDLRFMSGRLLEDEEKIEGTSDVVFTYVPEP